ncbi:hypothetical protein QW060_18115 [Myroides ceti]|uniref:Uncharacterized protein n=1 Tax=Paenimyroides ceti TaxID=395087 RepID=A0ABT8CWS9_9FLAO|nr:hypothetical protein [Paenimyroides ceti]MDN3708993.1 hypothetical protein [Paenimyroides ceti]
MRNIFNKLADYIKLDIFDWFENMKNQTHGISVTPTLCGRKVFNRLFKAL